MIETQLNITRSISAERTVGRHKDANFIVDSVHAIVVVHDKGKLHPPLPFFRLWTTQQLNVSRRRNMLHACEGENEKNNIGGPKHGGVVVVVPGVRVGPSVSNVSNQQDYHHLHLSLSKFSFSFPFVPHVGQGHDEDS